MHNIALPGVLGGMKATRRKAAVHYASDYLSCRNLKNLCLDPSLLCASFTNAVPSTIMTSPCVLRSTLAKL